MDAVHAILVQRCEHIRTRYLPHISPCLRKLTIKGSPINQETYNSISAAISFKVHSKRAFRLTHLSMCDFQITISKFTNLVKGTSGQEAYSKLKTETLGTPIAEEHGLTFSDSVGRKLIKNTIDLIQTSMLLHYCCFLPLWTDNSFADIWHIRSFLGATVLSDLEAVLSKVALAGASKEKLQALMVVLCSIYMAVEWSRPIDQVCHSLRKC